MEKIDRHFLLLLMSALFLSMSSAVSLLRFVSFSFQFNCFIFVINQHSGSPLQLMILVDDVGRAFPSLNHSPWFGVTLADFVMPFFLFVVGVSIGLVFKVQLLFNPSIALSWNFEQYSNSLIAFQKVSSKPNATKKILWRTIKLFLLGLLLQGMFCICVLSDAINNL